ncbi:hypothetical protein [Microbulbifer thermotolerans]|uniref:Uncharacterized protein n=1 Tax=Microbulbifer thermotolerans TaxID=252514 RepID=A0A143HI95_MICTH|nr:hypothetical protein [Microbulbifer thermotolerans]AMX01211.1 hypothetical protein A3224_00200 [Microbulbifer thermotolerans]MCX2778473.1 hypothetical protein [Microbulbifer thermotolerans]MCX2783944.1 hypothetical protein [Microbulbifer thermotolerans]MCX2793957.1 hypothetical protein [Microbulbifer thermotolerans]MCX2801661.1 hypothetical protein [Microbulbifer thermotolerans]
MCDDYKIIEDSIERAVTLERHQGRFLRSLQRSLPRLHRAIQVSQRDIAQQLTQFAIRYIQVVPEWLRQLETLCEVGGMPFNPVRETIVHGFAEPPERHPEQVGVAALLDDAYLAHRTFEEINDHLQPVCGMPLLPMDSMVANLVVRELLGEIYAVDLDQICMALGHQFRKQRLAPESLVAMILARQRLIETPGTWPDLAAEMGIALRLPLGERQIHTLH